MSGSYTRTIIANSQGRQPKDNQPSAKEDSLDLLKAELEEMEESLENLWAGFHRVELRS